MSDDSRAEADSRTVARTGEALAELLDRPLAAGLYVVATPIGNLADISLRALAVLSRARLIAAEDTRHSRKLLSNYNISAELTAYHDHNAARERPKLLARIEAGDAVALISDAGTPLVSDPGYKLVREALDAGLCVTSIPGPSAALAALTSAGLPTDSFLFGGFLPPRTGQRMTRLAAFKDVPTTLIFFETAPRLAKSLIDMGNALGPREAVIARELTKLHETLHRGTLESLAADIANESVKGEVAIIIAPPRNEATQVDDAWLTAELEEALETMTLRDAVRAVTDAHRVKRSRVYELGLSLTKRGTP